MNDDGKNKPGSGDTPPQSPLFSNAPGASPLDPGKSPFTDEQRKQIDKLKELIKEGKLGRGVPGIAGGNDRKHPPIKPFLLVRSVTGDNGTRPLAGGTVFWESPDIWTAVGDPATTPEIPPTHGGVLPAGKPNTVYAHVWNLGRAPLTGVVVSFYWFNPSLAIDGAHANLIGQTRIDLGPRNSPLCHKLVKCPKAWVPVMENGGHECLVVKVWGFGDAAPPNQWHPWEDRHVAQRNVSVVQTLDDMQKIISRIQLNVKAETRFELVQVGAEARDAVKIVASKLTLDPALATRSLAHLDAQNVLTVKPTDTVTPRIMPHTLTSGLSAGLAGAMTVKPGGAADLGEAADTPESGGAAGLGTAALGASAAKASAAGAAAKRITATNLTVANANLSTLVAHSALFDQTLLAGLKAAPPPAAGQAHVLRLVQYDGNQIVGGYTMVVGNAK